MISDASRRWFATSASVCSFMFALHSALGAEPALAGKPAIAILVTDTNQQTQTLSDLLTVKLSQAGKVDLVERKEIERVLAEQKLAASGLADSDKRILVGKLLRAKGLLFLEKDNRRNRMSVRLVESGQGFQVSQFLYALKDRKVEEVVADIEADLAKAVPKLDLNPSDRVLVSILRIGNATLSADYFWIEDDLPQLLGTYFSQDPRVLVLERRQFGALLTEAEVTSGSAGGFKAAGVIIDGEVALKPGQKVNDETGAVTFYVRLSGASQKTLGNVAVDGTLNKVEELVSKTAGEVLALLSQVGPKGGEKPQEESKVLLGLAQRQGVLWAAESAYAFDATNAAVARELVSSLLETVKVGSVNERVRALARAFELCKGLPERERIWFAYKVTWDYGDVLKNPATRSDAEMKLLLAPLRQHIRVCMEKTSIGADSFTLKRAADILSDDSLGRGRQTEGGGPAPGESASKPRPELAQSETVSGRIVFGPEMPEVKDLFNRVMDLWEWDSVSFALVPQYVLLDGDKLWIGVGSSEGIGFGVVVMDLATGRLAGSQFVKRRHLGWDYRLGAKIKRMCRWEDHVCLGVEGEGVYVLSMKEPWGSACELVDKSSGLMNCFICGLVAAGDDLYIGLPKALMKWDRKAKATTLVMNMESGFAGVPLKPNTSIVGVIGDLGGTNLYILTHHQEAFHGLDKGHVKGDYALLRVHVPNGQWTAVADPLPIPYQAGWFREMMPDEQTIFAAGIAKLEQGYGYAYLCRFRAQTGELTVFDAQVQPPPILVDGVQPQQSVYALPYREGTIAIVDGSVKHFTKAPSQP